MPDDTRESDEGRIDEWGSVWALFELFIADASSLAELVPQGDARGVVVVGVKHSLRRLASREVSRKRSLLELGLLLVLLVD